MSNNPPYASIDLTKEEYDFLLKNCESNLEVALGLLQDVNNRRMAGKLVALNEQFKAIRDKLKKARIGEEQ